MGAQGRKDDDRSKLVNHVTVLMALIANSFGDADSVSRVGC